MEIKELLIIFNLVKNHFNRYNILKTYGMYIFFFVIAIIEILHIGFVHKIELYQTCIISSFGNINGVSYSDIQKGIKINKESRNKRPIPVWGKINILESVKRCAVKFDKYLTGKFSKKIIVVHRFNSFEVHKTKLRYVSNSYGGKKYQIYGEMNGKLVDIHIDLKNIQRRQLNCLVESVLKEYDLAVFDYEKELFDELFQCLYKSLILMDVNRKDMNKTIKEMGNIRFGDTNSINFKASII